MSLKHLKPNIVWSIFEQILEVPRPSKKEDKIREWLVEFAKINNLKCVVDQKGNVVMVRDASKGFESRPTVVLQGHMDMVCEKNADKNHDFLNDPIEAYIEDGWVRAKGTTLGADCGIGMAMQLAAVVDQAIDTPKIEALFTVDEEQGLSGAMELDENILTGKYLVNLDSEDEGEIFIGCAGGVDTIATFDVKYQKPIGDLCCEIVVDSLKGGHSGDDIEKGRACANKILVRALSKIEKCNFQIATIDGGNLRNAIAREAKAVFVINETHFEGAKKSIESFFNNVKDEFKFSDENINVAINKCDEKVEKVLCEEDQKRLLLALSAVKHGVQQMSCAVEGLVETSTNLASVKQNGEQIVVTTSQRSSIESAKIDIARSVQDTFLLARASVQQTDGYPGWTPQPKCELVEIARTTYKNTFNKEPKIKAIHAGLECGLIIEKYPQMQAISIGPTLRGVHSPDEKLLIETVDQAWLFLINLLRDLK